MTAAAKRTGHPSLLLCYLWRLSPGGTTPRVAERPLARGFFLQANRLKAQMGVPFGPPSLSAARLSRSAIAYVAEPREAEQHHSPG
jgi:hypothetical protein